MAHTYEGVGPRSKRSYITTAAFHNEIWAYQTQLNPTSFKNEGRMVAATLPSGAALTAALCPAGRILREVGRKLFPGVHPGLVATDTWNGVAVGTSISYTGHMMVLVFDAVTGLKGFIDANNEILTVYNSDRANDFVDATENPSTGGAPARLGPSIYTAGNVVFAPTAFTLAATTTNVNFVTTPGTLYTTTLLGAGVATNLVATGVPAAGTLIYIRILGNGAGTNAVTFSTGFRSSATAIPGSGLFTTVTFLSDGTNLIEVSRATTV